MTSLDSELFFICELPVCWDSWTPRHCDGSSMPVWRHSAFALWRACLGAACVSSPPSLIPLGSLRHPWRVRSKVKSHEEEQTRALLPDLAAVVRATRRVPRIASREVSEGWAHLYSLYSSLRLCSERIAEKQTMPTGLTLGPALMVSASRVCRSPKPFKTLELEVYRALDPHRTL